MPQIYWFKLLKYENFLVLSLLYLWKFITLKVFHCWSDENKQTLDNLVWSMGTCDGHFSIYSAIFLTKQLIIKHNFFCCSHNSQIKGLKICLLIHTSQHNALTSVLVSAQWFSPSTHPLNGSKHSVSPSVYLFLDVLKLLL